MAQAVTATDDEGGGGREGVFAQTKYPIPRLGGLKEASDPLAALALSNVFFAVSRLERVRGSGGFGWAILPREAAGEA